MHVMKATLHGTQTRACKRKTLVLDLDETLVHSTLDGLDLPDFSFPVFFNGCAPRKSVSRPHAGELPGLCDCVHAHDS